MEQQIVTLTTDWGYRDFFAGMVKGKLYSYIPGVTVVDITHGIDSYDLRAALFVARQACPGFPKGTIHIIDVRSSFSPDTPFIVAYRNGQYYICTDNGLPYSLFGDDPSDIVAIDNLGPESRFLTFAANDLFCKVAAMISHGSSLSDLGSPVQRLTHITPYNNTLQPDGLTTYIAYIDAYGNADLHITYDEFERLRQGRPFDMTVHEIHLSDISPSYFSASSAGNNRASVLLTVSSTGHLQIAIREGSAEQLLGLRIMESIKIKFRV